MKKVIFPKHLVPGDKIAVVSPAGAVDASHLDQGLALIEANGYCPVLGKNALKVFDNGYKYAGTQAQRTSDLNQALNSDEIAAIWATRGGYGCQHLIKNLDLKGFKKYPKWFIGYSDNTVLQSFLLKKGFASIHGQTVKTADFGVTPESYQSIFDLLSGQFFALEIPNHHLSKHGTARGTLVGGNLALIYALLGTKYSFDFKNKILFIEDIGENFYSLDRMLMSLELAGVFKKISGIIIGGMTNMGSQNENSEYSESFDTFAYKIIADRISKYDFPAIFAFPNGHIYDNRPLIIGAEAEISIGENSALKYKLNG